MFLKGEMDHDLSLLAIKLALTDQHYGAHMVVIFSRD